ncbi:hypothetical protein chiPu_0006240 [Chiloscyllium punctatum]|uniref:Uncharacterized protein n=1 Tax=Chiloscyllium punctatum TaxID=137246 RepID=A0A401SBS1_CHIPU|nr:hypothetical protein [Chiloscyllium punctatum]
MQGLQRSYPSEDEPYQVIITMCIFHGLSDLKLSIDPDFQHYLAFIKGTLTSLGVKALMEIILLLRNWTHPDLHFVAEILKQVLKIKSMFEDQHCSTQS